MASDHREVCLHCYVSGRVQGVWFRDSTQKMAERLHIRGWVRNLADGRVETMICGAQDRVRQMEAWLWQGPRVAQVTQVEVHEVEWEDHDAFWVR